MAKTQDWRLEEELARARPTLRGITRVGDFLRPYRKLIAATLAMEVVWCFSYLLGPHLVRIAIDDYLVPGGFEGLLWLGAAYAANTVLRALWVGAELRLLNRAGHRVLADLRGALFRHVQRLSMGFFDRTHHGRIIARVDRDVDALEHPIVWGPVIVTSSVFILAIAVASMFYYDARLSFVVIACVPTMAISSEFFRRAGMKAYRKMRASLSAVTAHYAEVVNGIKVIQAARQESRSLARDKELIEGLRNDAIETIRIWSTYLPVVSMHYGVSAALLLLFGGKLVAQGEVTVGELVAFLMLLENVFEPIEELGEFYNELLGASAAGERIFQLLDQEPDIVERPTAKPLQSPRGEIRFDAVRFRYSETLPWVIHGVSFEIAAGSTVAFVGKTGAGKSSIVGLICRLYEAQEGRVRIDGKDIREVTIDSLRDTIAMIPQDGYLFSGTVLDNLRFARPEASREEIERAAKELGAHRTLLSLPSGYETEVGERGSRLSHGQRQAVCYVRALLRDPAVLVLDEATSALDAATESTLQHALEKLSRGRTTVVIAHRLSTIRNADRIFVVDGGRIRESGTHDELMGRGGAYNALYGRYGGRTTAS